MGDRFTEEQRRAIEASGRTIVSASAGSGKTTVMIEKIIRLIRDGCAVENILAVTFTKKAASQMKEKLCNALIKSINAEDVSKERKKALKEQLSQVPTADISTIHSFCAKLLRSHFYTAEIDNAFRVIGGDDAEGIALKNEALNELFEEGYENKDEYFSHLLGAYWRKKSDTALRNILAETYETLRNRADYREYLQNSALYDEAMFEAVCRDLHAYLQEKCRYYKRLLEKEKYFFEGEGVKNQTALSGELIGYLDSLLSAPDYFAACQCPLPSFTRNVKPKDNESVALRAEKLAELKDKVTGIYKSELSKTKSKEEELQNFLRAGKTAAALASALLRFDELYAQLKREHNALDYNDLEHKALALLKNEEIAAELREKYTYVFVDEYQDVNPVQEEIISRLSGENLFLVGDVKQSIYGFRGSKSKFFVQKQKEFSENGGNALAMTRNFRSSDAVLDAVNSQFSLAMNLDTCSVDYKSDSYMERGGRYKANDGRVQIHVVNEDEKTFSETRDVYSVEAKSKSKNKAAESAVARTIRHIIEQECASTYYDPETESYRRVTYSDIAVLSRKKQGQIAKTVAALSESGIPVTAAAAVNICEYAEIKTLIDVLSLIDNAQQDIPLCSALCSPMGNLTADDLAKIRLAYPDEGFFRTACEKYTAEKTDFLSEKLRKFYAYFQSLRLLSDVSDAGELLVKILSDTRMEATLLSQKNGTAALKRIHRFIEETNAEEPLSVHAFLERLRDLDYTIECSENGGDDSVKVLTMHSSKGLEYPVVIVDDLSASFRGADGGDVLVEEKYALAPRAYDETTMIKYPTLLRRLHEKREQLSSIADELNLYYVALTRAKYGLHLIFKKIPEMPDVRYATSFAEFTDFDVWQKYFVRDEWIDLEKQDRMPLAFRPDETLAKKIADAFLWRYEYAGYENLPVKSSATALLDGAEYKADSDGGAFVEADFDADTDKDSGVAYHAFLERFDFSILRHEENLTEKIEELRTCMLRENVVGAERLSTEKLTEILRNPVFKRLLDKRLYKEQQFLVSLPIRDTYALKSEFSEELQAKGGEEEMIFQGALDLLAVGEEAEIVDYKYSRKNAKSLRAHYKPQLDLYRRAVSKILKLPSEKIHCTIVNIYYGFEVNMD